MVFSILVTLYLIVGLVCAILALLATKYDEETIILKEEVDREGKFMYVMLTILVLWPKILYGIHRENS